MLILFILIFLSGLIKVWMDNREKKFLRTAKEGDACRFSYMYQKKLQEGFIEEYDKENLYAIVKDSDGFQAKVFTHSIKAPKLLCGQKKFGKTRYFQN